MADKYEELAKTVDRVSAESMEAVLRLMDESPAELKKLVQAILNALDGPGPKEWGPKRRCLEKLASSVYGLWSENQDMPPSVKQELNDHMPLALANFLMGLDTGVHLIRKSPGIIEEWWDK